MQGNLRGRIRALIPATVTALLLCAVSALYLSGVRGAFTVAAGKRELPVYSVERTDGKIAISFDAAWGDEKTVKILDILDEYDVKTTFFLVDIWTKRYPDTLKEIVRRGHEIGNHSTSHPHMSQLSEAQIVRELKDMSDRVEELTGLRPTLFRPPYGDYDNEVVSVSRAEGYEIVQWSVDSVDWKNRGAQDIVTRCTRGISSGDIVLFHNDSQYILEALPAVLQAYRDKGLSVVKISDLLLPAPVTIDHAGRQHAAPDNH